MEPKKQLFIVEDHRLFREGLKAMLSPSPEFEIVGEAEDGLESVRLVKKQKPDLVSMPRMGGFSVLREIKGAIPEVKILVLTGRPSIKRKPHTSQECWKLTFPNRFLRWFIMLCVRMIGA